MKSPTPRIAGGTVALLTVKPQIAVIPPTEAHPATTYSLLLAGPTALLVGHVMDRPDVQSVAILGYN